MGKELSSESIETLRTAEADGVAGLACFHCGGPTGLRCSDCAIENELTHEGLPICGRRECRDKHDEWHTRATPISELEDALNRGAEVSILPNGRVVAKASDDDSKPLTFKQDLGGEYAMSTNQTYLEAMEGQCSECRKWLVWADNLTGNKHYLASKMRQEISVRLSPTAQATASAAALTQQDTPASSVPHEPESSSSSAPKLPLIGKVSVGEWKRSISPIPTTEGGAVELLPCPFCGTSPTRYPSSNSPPYVRCENVACPICNGAWVLPWLWNTRAVSSPAVDHQVVAREKAQRISQWLASVVPNYISCDLPKIESEITAIILEALKEGGHAPAPDTELLALMDTVDRIRRAPCIPTKVARDYLGRLSRELRKRMGGSKWKVK